MQLQLYQFEHGNCPYLPDRNWTTHSFQINSIPDQVYEAMLADGWRRSGKSFYQNHCTGCRCCTPLRIPVNEFRPSRSQRRAANRNSDVLVEMSDPTADPESFDLYQRYVQARHTARPPEMEMSTERPGPPAESEPPGSESGESLDQFRMFLVDSAVTTRVMKYRVAGRLVGLGWVDILPDGLSSVYYAFDPDEGRRSLGIFSITREIEMARAMNKRWLYLGFFVPGSPKMQYKGEFHPCEFAVDGRWTRDESVIPC